MASPTPVPTTPPPTSWAGDDMGADESDGGMDENGWLRPSILAASLSSHAVWMRARARVDALDPLSSLERRAVADRLGELLAAAVGVEAMDWGSGELTSAIHSLFAGRVDDVPPSSYARHTEDVVMDPVDPPPPRRPNVPPTRGRPPRGARPLPIPPGRGGRGGSVRGGRGIGPPPPINRATRPPPAGKGSYAQTARFPGGLPSSSVDGIVRLAKAFPELPTQQLEVMQRAAVKPKRKPPKASATVHGPSCRQVLVSVHPPVVGVNPADFLDRVRLTLSLHHSRLEVESASVHRDGFAVVTTQVASDEDLQFFKEAARVAFPTSTRVDATLPSSTSYLKLVDVPFTVNDTAITPDQVLAQIAKARLQDLVVLQTPPRVVRDSPKSDTCTVYFNVADSVSGARAKGLTGRTVQFGRFVSTFRAARANPGSPLCARCWRWGHPTSACRAPQIRCPTCLGPHRKEHHRTLSGCCKGNANATPPHSCHA